MLGTVTWSQFYIFSVISFYLAIKIGYFKKHCVHITVFLHIMISYIYSKILGIYIYKKLIWRPIYFYLFIVNINSYFNEHPKSHPASQKLIQNSPRSLQPLRGNAKARDYPLWYPLCRMRGRGCSTSCCCCHMGFH